MARRLMTGDQALRKKAIQRGTEALSEDTGVVAKKAWLEDSEASTPKSARISDVEEAAAEHLPTLGFAPGAEFADTEGVTGYVKKRPWSPQQKAVYERRLAATMKDKLGPDAQPGFRFDLEAFRRETDTMEDINEFDEMPKKYGTPESKEDPKPPPKPPTTGEDHDHGAPADPGMVRPSAPEVDLTAGYGTEPEPEGPANYVEDPDAFDMDRYLPTSTGLDTVSYTHLTLPTKRIV